MKPCGLGLALIAVALAAPLAFAQTHVRATPGGPLLLFVDGDKVLQEPAGKPLLFIDGQTLRPDPNGKRLLFIDNNRNIRPEPGGVRLALFDDTDHTLRRKPAGPILAWIKHPEIREEGVAGKLLYVLDGPALSDIQVVAVLHHLKPDFFKLSDEEIARKKEMMKEAAKEDEQLRANRLLGKFSSASTNLELFKEAKAEVAQAKDCFSVTLSLKDGRTLAGIGVPREVEGQKEIWFAASPKGAVSLAVYEMKGKELDGVWLPMDCLTEGKEAGGTEKLKLTKPGRYEITAATAPKSGAAYKGTMQVTQLPADAAVTFETYTVQWQLEKKKLKGIGFLAKTGAESFAFAAAAGGSDTEWMLGRLLHSESSGVHIDYFTSGKRSGFILLERGEK